MKILVTVKEVAEVEDDFELDDRRIDERYVEYDMNEWDEYAVEEAVGIAEAADGDVEVVSVTVGPERCEETIRLALAKGVGRAIRVWDDALADVELLDVAAKTRILRRIVEREQPELVLTGVQASDDNFSATGVSLADAVGYQWAAVVNALDLDAAEGLAQVRRELEGGVEELTEVTLPAVLTVQTGINEPRYASLRGIRQAQRKEIDEATLADLDLDAESVAGDLELTAMYEPEGESDATFFGGSAEDAASELAAVLRDRGVGAE